MRLLLGGLRFSAASVIRMIRFIKDNKIIIAIIAVSVALRMYKAPEHFMYAHDGDLAGWIIRDIVENKHLRLIGQETSQQGIFIGPLFYYFLIPFYALFNMDPIGGFYGIIAVGVLTTVSYYFVFRRVFSIRAGHIAALIHATSYFMIFNDREMVPTSPVMLWLVWYFYAITLILKGKRIGLLIVGLLAGLVWSLIMSLVLVLPLAPLAMYLSKKKFDIKGVMMAAAISLLLSLPLILFELRHSFSQSTSLLRSIGEEPDVVADGFARFDRVLQLVTKNVSYLISGPILSLTHGFWFSAMVLSFIFIYKYRQIPKNLFIILTVWIISVFAFFSLYSANVSEYYLNAMAIVWIVVMVVGVGTLLSVKKYKKFGKYLLIGFVSLNLFRYVTVPTNKIGYIYKKQLVAFIVEDAKLHNYPCVSVSYITDPGYNLGYRYFYWLEGLHVNQPKSESPVYSIVFPHSLVDRIDKSFGAIGLIYPEYDKYSMEEVIETCSGQNSNITDPMFGFTK